MRKILFALVAVFLLVAPVNAAPPTNPELVVEPDFGTTIEVGETYTISGGVEFSEAIFPDGTLKVNLCNPGCLLAFAVGSNPDGSFEWHADGYFTPGFAGTYYFRVLDTRPNGRLYRFAEVAYTVGP